MARLWRAISQLTHPRRPGGKPPKPIPFSVLDLNSVKSIMVTITVFSNIITSSKEFQGRVSEMARGLRVPWLGSPPHKRVEVFGTLDICLAVTGLVADAGGPGRALGLRYLSNLMVPKFAGKGDPRHPRPPQDLTWKKPVLVPRRSPPVTWPLVGATVPLAVGRQASVLDRPAPSMSRGLSAGQHRMWAAHALSLGIRV